MDIPCLSDNPVGEIELKLGHECSTGKAEEGVACLGCVNGTSTAQAQAEEPGPFVVRRAPNRRRVPAAKL